VLNEALRHAYPPTHIHHRRNVAACVNVCSGRHTALVFEIIAGNGDGTMRALTR
jgi:hypothetical protein